MKRKQIQKIVELAVKGVLTDGKLSESKVIKVIKVFKSRPKSESIALISTFLKAIKREQERTTLIVEAASPLLKTEMNKIKEKLKSEYLILNSEFKINTSLIGGIKVKIKDHIFEDSIMSRINQLKEAIIN